VSAALVSAVSQVTDERAITAISLVHPSRRSGISSIDGNLSLDTQRNTNSQDGQQWCNHVKANQRQAFKPHFTFPSIHLFLTSLSSHHTSQRAIPPSDAWRPRARSQHGVGRHLPSAIIPHTPNPNRASFRTLPPTRIPHTLAATTASITHNHRATMSQPAKCKRTENDGPPVKNSRRRMNVLEAADLAKERIAHYRARHPVSIRPCQVSTIHRSTYLTRRRT
jgi:hypothetical protein